MPPITRLRIDCPECETISPLGTSNCPRCNLDFANGPLTCMAGHPVPEWAPKWCPTCGEMVQAARVRPVSVTTETPSATSSVNYVPGASSQTVGDLAVGRRTSWDGEVVVDMRPNSPTIGQYFIVTASHRIDARHWWINTQFLSHNRPEESEVWIWDGRTWDMNRDNTSTYTAEEFWNPLRALWIVYGVIAAIGVVLASVPVLDFARPGVFILLAIGFVIMVLTSGSVAAGRRNPVTNRKIDYAIWGAVLGLAAVNAYRRHRERDAYRYGPGPYDDPYHRRRGMTYSNPEYDRALDDARRRLGGTRP